jgi:hypothetical protein
MKKTWEEMTRSERKVAVAKDVRAHILAKSFKVTPGTYLNVYKDLDELPDSQSQAQCLLSTKINKCEACARGAMMLVKVAKWNHWDGNFDFRIDNYKTFKALEDAFTEEELNLIECIFERSCNFMDSEEECYFDNEDGVFAERYGASPIKWGPNKPDDRLLCIMQSIIDHDGEFKPEVEYEIKVTK